jgi:hypothetical protein
MKILLQDDEGKANVHITPMEHIAEHIRAGGDVEIRIGGYDPDVGMHRIDMQKLSSFNEVDDGFAKLREENRRLREFFNNKVYILERAPEDELSDRYRVEVTKLRKALEAAEVPPC